jgi:hypothetical protein
VRNTYAADVAAEWNAAIPSEGPEQSRCACHYANCRSCQHNKDQGNHESRARFAVRSLQEYFNERKSGRTIQCIVDISKVEEQRYLFSLKSDLESSGASQHTKRAKPIVPFNIMEDIITQGTTVEAF